MTNLQLGTFARRVVRRDSQLHQGSMIAASVRKRGGLAL